MHFCARAHSGFFSSTYAHRDALAIYVTASLGAVHTHTYSQSISACVSGREKSRACPGTKMHHWVQDGISGVIYINKKHLRWSFVHKFCKLNWGPSKARIRLKIKIEIRLKFNQSEGRKPISSLVSLRWTLLWLVKIQSNLNPNL